MNLAHLHLLLNHWPIIGTFIATGLFLVALAGRKEELKEMALALFALMGLVAIPSYLSGYLVEDVILQQGIGSRPQIDAHQGAALLALIALLITGSFAWVGVWQMRRRALAPWTTAAVLVCAAVTVALMAIAGNTGGAIRHPEILSGESASPSAVGNMGLRLGEALEYFATGSNRWVWPFLEVFHFVGLALLMGTMGILNLRLLGMFRHVPVAPFHRFLPWGVAGLAINVITGMLFFIGMPGFYIYNADFHLKIVALVIAGSTLLVQSTSAFSSSEQVKAGQDASVAVQVFAATSLFLWVAVIVFGRYMPLYEDTLDPRFVAALLRSVS